MNFQAITAKLQDDLGIVRGEVGDCDEGDAKLIMAALQAAYASGESAGRIKGLEEAAVIVSAEPELPGEMPDEMWAFCRDRKNCTESHQAAVRATKNNILAALKSKEPAEENGGVGG